MRKLAFALFLTAPWLAACASAPSDSATVLVASYTPAFQAAVAAEYETLSPACQPNDPTTPPGCSTLKTLIDDYLLLRDRLRVQ